MGSRVSSIPTPTENYYFELVKSKERDEVLKFLLEHFRFDEPLNRASQITEDEIKGCLEGVLDRVLKNEVSILARSKQTKEVVGCMLNSVWKREDHSKTQENEKDFDFGATRKEVAVIGEILNELHESFWTLRTDQNVVLHFEISSVAKDHRRKGLASIFMNFAENPEVLKSVGATGIAAEASSFANQALLEKRGYKTLASTLLSTKVDKDTGKQLLNCDDGTDRVNLVFKQF